MYSTHKERDERERKRERKRGEKVASKSMWVRMRIHDRIVLST
jgi:hypothetical protein